MTASDPLLDFVRAHTTIGHAALVPELRLHLATELTPLWTASEAFLQAAGIEPPYWAFAWPGAQAAARWVLDEGDWLNGARVIDFGAGGGLAAIAAARRGARVLAIEVDPVAGAAIAANAALNGVEVEVFVGDVTGGPALPADLVFGGDVCYALPMVERVLPWLRRCAAAGAEVLLVDPGRLYVPAGLEEIATYAVPTLLELEDRPVRHTRLLRLPG